MTINKYNAILQITHRFKLISYYTHTCNEKLYFLRNGMLQNTCFCFLSIDYWIWYLAISVKVFFKKEVELYNVGILKTDMSTFVVMPLYDLPWSCSCVFILSQLYRPIRVCFKSSSAYLPYKFSISPRTILQIQ